MTSSFIGYNPPIDFYKNTLKVKQVFSLNTVYVLDEPGILWNIRNGIFYRAIKANFIVGVVHNNLLYLSDEEQIFSYNEVELTLVSSIPGIKKMYSTSKGLLLQTDKLYSYYDNILSDEPIIPSLDVETLKNIVEKDGDLYIFDGKTIKSSSSAISPVSLERNYLNITVINNKFYLTDDTSIYYINDLGEEELYADHKIILDDNFIVPSIDNLVGAYDSIAIVGNTFYTLKNGIVSYVSNGISSPLKMQNVSAICYNNGLLYYSLTTGGIYQYPSTIPVKGTLSLIVNYLYYKVKSGNEQFNTIYVGTTDGLKSITLNSVLSQHSYSENNVKSISLFGNKLLCLHSDPDSDLISVLSSENTSFRLSKPFVSMTSNSNYIYLSDSKNCVYYCVDETSAPVFMYFISYVLNSLMYFKDQLIGLTSKAVLNLPQTVSIPAPVSVLSVSSAVVSDPIVSSTVIVPPKVEFTRLPPMRTRIGDKVVTLQSIPSNPATSKLSATKAEAKALRDPAPTTSSGLSNSSIFWIIFGSLVGVSIIFLIIMIAFRKPLTPSPVFSRVVVRDEDYGRHYRTY
jgi:hypothetical protein